MCIFCSAAPLTVDVSRSSSSFIPSASGLPLIFIRLKVDYFGSLQDGSRIDPYEEVERAESALCQWLFYV
ncbi:hypothetical protein L1987_27343 [Smallanthus sonchifolius]|uniref:Uncharacterized protein n=1 Tax=Smallanthus sonchifolius TaxID=185202 RepID=A0ACB9IAH3_9ASTR|nr:hypothetical protein L1987_27343 [Smallanthus sonchifolius]